MNPTQDDAILGYMENHDKFAANKRLGNNAGFQRKKQLSHLKEIVDERGNSKTPQQIERVWKAKKAEARKYNAEKRIFYEKTGNDTSENFSVDNEMERVLDIVGTSHGNGLNIVKEIGFQSSSSSNTVVGSTSSRKRAATKNNVVYVMSNLQDSSKAINRAPATTKKPTTGNKLVISPRRDLHQSKTITQTVAVGMPETPQQIREMEQQMLNNLFLSNAAAMKTSHKGSIILDITNLPPQTASTVPKTQHTSSTLAQFFQTKSHATKPAVTSKHPEANEIGNKNTGPQNPPSLIKKYLQQNSSSIQRKSPILLDNTSFSDGSTNAKMLVPFGEKNQALVKKTPATQKSTTEEKNNYTSSNIYNQYLSSWRRKPSKRLDSAVQIMETYVASQSRLAEGIEDLVSVKKQKLEIYEDYCKQKLNILKNKK